MLKDFIDRLGLAEVLENEIGVKQRQRGYRDEEAIEQMAMNLILGGDSLSDLEVMRGDEGTLQLLGYERCLASTTAGEHLRKFDIGDNKDLVRGLRQIARKVRPLQTSKHCTIDLDSSVYEQSSKRKEGSCRTYNGEIGYHPLLAFWAEEGELLGTHLMAGNRHPSSKASWFLREVLNNAPPVKGLSLRADSAFYSWDFIDELESHEITYGITADMTKQFRANIEKIEEDRWRPFGKDAEVAEMRYAPSRREEHRYVVKRVWLKDKKTEEGYYRYHAVITNDEKKSARRLMKWALQRCNMENLIKEHKSGFGLEKMPTQKFQANQTWLLIGQLAYNLVAWFKRLVLPKQYHKATIGTIRHRILNLAGKIVRSSRQYFLVLSDKYFYKDVWRFALKQLARLTTRILIRGFELPACALTQLILRKELDSLRDGASWQHALRRNYCDVRKIKSGLGQPLCLP